MCEFTNNNVLIQPGIYANQVAMVTYLYTWIYKTAHSQPDTTRCPSPQA